MIYKNGRDYRSLHPTAAISDDKFRSLAEHFAAVADPDHRDSRLKPIAGEQRTNVIGSGVYGGYSVPEAFSEILFNQVLLADPVFMSRAFLLPMSGPSVLAPMWDVEDRSAGNLFGLSIQWSAENSTIDIPHSRADHVEWTDNYGQWRGCVLCGRFEITLTKFPRPQPANAAGGKPTSWAHIIGRHFPLR